MSQEEYSNVMDEYISMIYSELYKEYQTSGEVGVYSPVILSRLDLPLNADETTIKKRFRKLAKKYHSDTGGNAEKFIEILDDYKKLLGNRK